MMWFRSVLDALLARSTRPVSRVRPRLETLEDRLVLSTYTVNSLGDTGAGSGLAGDLRYCLTHATSGSDTITFAQGLTGTIAISEQTPLPTLNASVAIQGPGANQINVDATTSWTGGGSPVFSVGMGAYVQISGLTIGNSSQGDAIDNSGKLLVNSCTLLGSFDSINNKGSATVSNSTFSRTGPLLNSGTLTVADSTFYVNDGIENLGGSATISYSTISHGTQAIYNAGTMTLNNSTISGNYAYGLNAYLQVNGTWPSYGTTQFIPAANGMGGGIYMASGALSINSSTIADNEAIGGSTDGFGGTAGNGLGGGLYIAGGTVTINNSTFAGNQAVSGKTSSFYGGSPGVGYGGGIDNAAGPSALQMYDTILADNTGSAAPDLNGSVTSQGHNLIGNTTGGSGFIASDLQNVNPKLGPLQNNGGPTQTMALLVDSPALNAGNNTNAPAYDQRGPGFSRIVGSAIDIGAFEDQNTAFLQVNGFPSSATAGTANTFTVTALNANGTVDPNYTGTVHFTSSDTQAGLPADYTFTAADAGVHTFSATLKTAGSQSLTATDTANGIIVGSETGITVNPAAAASLAFYYGAPSSTTAGSAFTVLVVAKDAYGNYATGYRGTVHFTSSDPKAVLPANYTFTSSDNGQQFFSITLKKAGTQSLTVKDTVTASLTGTQSGILVNAAAASKFVLAAPTSVNPGAPFNLTVTVEDAYGNVVTSYAGTVHFTSTDSSATLPKNYTFTATDKGVHTFTGLVLRKKGNQTITITDTQRSSLTGNRTVDVL
jgi:hypothetical protein